MRIQTNGLPDHCLPLGNNTLSESLIDIQFVYSPVPQTTFRKPNTVMDLNHFVCDFDQSDESRIPKDSGYVNLGDYSPSITNMVGVAINGVPMFNGNGPNNTDFFYPQ